MEEFQPTRVLHSASEVPQISRSFPGGGVWRGCGTSGTWSLDSTFRPLGAGQEGYLSFSFLLLGHNDLTKTT